jgi:two-component system, OmpR family, sensor kinase
MTSAERVQARREGARHLFGAFAVIIGGFLLANAVSIYLVRTALSEVSQISEHALNSTELASRLSRNLYKKRLLIEAHIFEKNTVNMQYIEGELVGIDALIAATSRAYEPIAVEQGERAAWQELQADLANVQPKIEKAIDLSRENRDQEAQAIMKEIEAPLEKLNDDTDTLVRINRVRAQEEVDAINGLQFETLVVQVVLTVAWTAFALLTARWVIRLIRDRERQMHERNRELDAFAGRVAHDLRGPLTKIYLASSMLEHRKVMPEASAPLRRGVDQMEGIIQDLLTLSRISAQTMDETGQTADVAAALEEDFRSRVEAIGGKLRVQVAPASVKCNPGLLRQAVSNLAENAVKYRRPKVPLVLEIRGRVVSHAYELSVSDNGTGMSPTDVKQAFEPFFRGEQVTGIPGTGLGLSIVKRAIEANGGSVDVHSALGHGTTVNIQLPLAASKAA